MYSGNHCTYSEKGPARVSLKWCCMCIAPCIQGKQGEPQPRQSHLQKSKILESPKKFGKIQNWKTRFNPKRALSFITISAMIYIPKWTRYHLENFLGKYPFLHVQKEPTLGLFLLFLFHFHLFGYLFPLFVVTVFAYHALVGRVTSTLDYFPTLCTLVFCHTVFIISSNCFSNPARSPESTAIV